MMGEQRQVRQRGAAFGVERHASTKALTRRRRQLGCWHGIDTYFATAMAAILVAGSRRSADRE
jgi:hypothetical protein